jgi:hypothetical protein
MLLHDILGNILLGPDGRTSISALFACEPHDAARGERNKGDKKK